MRSKIFVVLSLLWAVMIFMFSARTAEESTEDSFWVGMKFGALVISDFEEWSEENQLAFAEKVDHPIRKTAHATEYAIFAMLLLGAFYKKKEEVEPTETDKSVVQYRNFLIPWLTATGYAGTDEFHQLFVEGRSGQVSDVCLDSFGALVGILIVLGIMKIRRQSNKKKCN